MASDALQAGGGADSVLAGARVPSAAPAAAREPRPDPAFAGQPTLTLGPAKLPTLLTAGRRASLGPLHVHAGQVARHFRLRQRFDLGDRLGAAVGGYYDFKSGAVGPLAALTYSLDPNDARSKSRLEVSVGPTAQDSRLLARRGWEVKIASATVGLAAEASVPLRRADRQQRQQQYGSGGGGAGGGSSGGVGALFGPGGGARPDLHLSLDYVKPFKAELALIAAVLALNLPLRLSHKEAEARLPFGLGRLRLFGRASVQRTGYAAAKVGFSDVSGVLEL